MMVASPMRPARLTVSLRRRSRSAAVWRELRNSQVPPAISKTATAASIETSKASLISKKPTPDFNIVTPASQDG